VALVTSNSQCSILRHMVCEVNSSRKFWCDEFTGKCKCKCTPSNA